VALSSPSDPNRWDVGSRRDLCAPSGMPARGNLFVHMGSKTVTKATISDVFPRLLVEHAQSAEEHDLRCSDA
jgi:hypothetical protein